MQTLYKTQEEMLLIQKIQKSEEEIKKGKSKKVNPSISAEEMDRALTK
ncbi:MAG: hypothetical protein PHT91_00350 [Candidatus Nanoarchaeia archaeon]|nr:hypothetical protein [Candidatus Nanoarchaeia archaeon]MDD5053941.1 hypothetical protein [Candidatus Nanoarchaeia archaeon]MDD5499310.1 hypothetical protein [Candidatus Nanoarchaeia archaeon]